MQRLKVAVLLPLPLPLLLARIVCTQRKASNTDQPFRILMIRFDPMVVERPRFPAETIGNLHVRT